MNRKEQVERIHWRLEEERRLFDGRKSEIDARLGHQPGYLTRILNGEGSLDIETLCATLEILGLDPRVFFTRVFGRLDRLDVVGLLESIEKQSRDVEPDGRVSKILDRVEKALLVAEDDVGEKMSEVDSRPMYSRLEELNDLRFFDATRAEAEVIPTLKATLNLTPGLSGEATRELFAKCLGVTASILRLRARFSVSARALRIALQAVQDLGDGALRAELLQRASYLVGDHGEHEIAAGIASQSVEGYLLTQDFEGVGKALMSRGFMLYESGDAQSAIKMYLSSLDYLPEAAWQYRFSAIQGLGVAYFDLDELDRAYEYVLQAKSMNQAPKGRSWAKLIWLEGDISLKRSHLEVAEVVLRNALEIFVQSGDSLDIVLVCLSLSKALLRTNKVSELGEIASVMMGCSTLVGKNKIVRAAIDEFILSVLRGEITLDRVEQIRQRMEEAGASGWRRPRRR